VLRQHGFRAGEHTVGYYACDDSTAQTGGFEARRCAANANAYARAARLVAVIGPYNSDCAGYEIPILNRAPGGAVAMIGPSTSGPELTRTAGASLGYRGEPDVYYPTGVRNFVRLAPDDDLQGAAFAVLSKRLGLRSVYVLDDGSDLWTGLLSDPFRRAAKKLGVRIAGSARFDPTTEDFAPLAERVARSGAQGVVVGGDPFDGGDRLVRALRARLGQRAAIMGGFFFAVGVPDMLNRVGPAARGMYVTTNDLPRAVLPLGPAGRRFASEVGATATQFPYVLEAGQATELVLKAIARSDGTRASVLRELRASEVRNGILGSFRFDRNGDISVASVPILRITGSTPPSAGLPSSFQGAVIDRVVRVPSSLVK
jgi:branched-chain amino acid transport system substrate-binding protein